MAYTNLLNIGTLSEMTDLQEKEFNFQGTLIKPVAEQLFITENLEAHTGNTRRYDEVDVQTFAKLKNEGDDASKVEAGIGYNITMTAKRVAAEIEITWEMLRYNKKSNIVSKMTGLPHHCPQRYELDLTHRLTFCSSTSYTDQDGETINVYTGAGSTNPLVYATNGLSNSTSTYRNRVSGDPIFSQGALESAELLATTDVLSNFGEKRTMNFNTIVSSNDPNTCRTIKQVLQSTADIDASHAGVLNYYANSYTHIILPNLATTAAGANDSTKRKWWFIAAIGNGIEGSLQAYAGIFEPNNLHSPAGSNNGVDVHNDNMTYGTRMSYGIAILSGRGLIGSLPTTA